MSSLKEKLKKRKKQLKSKKGYPYFTFPEGVHRMRPMPVKNDERLDAEVIMFYVDNKRHISPASFDEPCALYDKMKELESSQDESDKELLEKFSISRRFMVPHLKYLDEKGTKVDKENGVKLACLTGNQLNSLIDLFLDDEQGDFTDPEDGYDIKYERTGRGMVDTAYSLRPCRPSPIPEEYRGKEYDPVAMAKELAIDYETSEELLDSLLGDALDDESEEEETPKRRVKKRVKKSTSGKARKRRKSSNDM